MQGGIPALTFGPGSIGSAHSADESVPLVEVVEAAQVLAALIADYCGGRASAGQMK
jgi:acetylornithine deacetylase/succinyl-diaminopimelate desuccinylase-like protein